VTHCLATQRLMDGSSITVPAKRFLLMAKSDWLVLLGSALLFAIPAPVHSEDPAEGDRAAFAIKHVGTCGDVKTRLWGRINVAAVVPDLSIRCDESSSSYPWKIAIVSTDFGSAK